MKVLHNGEEIEITEGMTLTEFNRKFQYRRVMIKLNGEQLTASDFPTTVLKEGDEITAKRISGGG